MLSASNNDPLRLGKVLGAHGIILPEKIEDGSNPFISIRFVAVQSGIVIISHKFPWPIESISEWAAGLIPQLCAAAPKLILPPKELVPLSVLNLRSSVQSSQARELEKHLTILTIERLSREPQLLLLERRKMQALGDELWLNGENE